MADKADIAQELIEHRLDLALANRAQEPSQESSGYCADCDEPIPEARLKSLPCARYCVDCQALRERRR